jgi:hypothetical protein
MLFGRYMLEEWPIFGCWIMSCIEQQASKRQVMMRFGFVANHVRAATTVNIQVGNTGQFAQLEWKWA